MLYGKIPGFGLLMVFLSGFVLSASAEQTGPLAQIIEGAKKEGMVSSKMRSGVKVQSVPRLEKEILQKFGVNLKISFTPSAGMPDDLSQAIMEQKAGAPASFDMMNFNDSFIPLAMKTGILEKVDWKTLITKNTNPKAVLTHPALAGAIIYYTGHAGLMYNSQKVRANEVPKSLSELSQPKWKEKVGLLNYTQSWAIWAFVLGKEKIFSNLKEMLNNGAVLGRYVDLQNFYLIGELPLCVTGSIYMKEAQDKGVPTAWKTLNFGEIQNFTLSLRKGAQHPNAAKLLAVYLASPEGAKFIFEESGAGNLFYPGNPEHDISTQALKENIPEYSVGSFPGLLDFRLSNEFNQWEKEVKLIFDTVKR